MQPGRVNPRRLRDPRPPRRHRGQPGIAAARTAAVAAAPVSRASGQLLHPDEHEAEVDQPVRHPPEGHEAPRVQFWPLRGPAALRQGTAGERHPGGEERAQTLKVLQGGICKYSSTMC